MDVKWFDYDLPETSIAQVPTNDRTASKLMCLNKLTGQIEHERFTNLLDYLQAGDTLIFNNTKVIPARLIGTKPDTGAKIELLLHTSLGEDRWEVLARPAKRLKQGATVQFGDSVDGKPVLVGEIESEGAEGNRTVRFKYEGIFQEVLAELGEMPLPPYIKEQLSDRDRYQTVYGVVPGSAAAPTAGLHFTESFMEQLQNKGIHIGYVTLHVGLGTFKPVTVERTEEHTMHEEYYRVTQTTVEQIIRAKENNNRVIAVGTTAARVLETVANRYDDGELAACDGWTNIFITPGYRFKLVDALLTNFHLPQSTLLMMVSAFSTREYIMDAYENAIRHHYRFFSFGDAMFIY